MQVPSFGHVIFSQAGKMEQLQMKKSNTKQYYWWLVRVILVVDWVFLPRNFGLVVGTYKGLLLFCECT